MTSSEFNSKLFAAFPELREIAIREFDYYDFENKEPDHEDKEPGHYVVFEDVLRPAIEEAASRDENKLKKLMQFVEEVAQNDENIVGVCLGEVLPTLINKRQILECAGPVTRRILC